MARGPKRLAAPSHWMLDKVGIFVFNFYEIIIIVSAIFISEEELLFSSEESSLPDRPRDLTSCASLSL